ncbi:hypothetical protein JZ751_015165 [Albula glossodonta]|uniref:GMP phosphodiesterase delta subunit domain-containing protein n=1 Tax=Albula glossodonta TaxID=121402 RepID=A0A8T2NRV9_9TELE|nr:hypothetical protein JZ751_015165 [Albula glossodonta]
MENVEETERGSEEEGEVSMERELGRDRGQVGEQEMEDWNGFISGEQDVEVAEVLDSGDTITPNHVLRLTAYTDDHLLKTFDFEIGFCIPYSRNTCEHIYTLPELDSDTVEEMIANPFETKSDSFYFANNKLIMHHKAEYSFSESRGPQY